MTSSFFEDASCMLNSGAITSIKFSPKGDKIGVATSVGHLFIFKESFGYSEPSIEFPPSDGPINHISWDMTDESGNYIFAVTEAGSIWRYNISSLSVLKIYTMPDTSFLSCESSLSNSYIATGSTKGDLLIFKSDEIREPNSKEDKNFFINENSVRTVKAHSDSITGISFRKDGLQLITCSYDSLVRVWGVDLICTHSFCFRVPLLSVIFQFSGKMFYICGSDNSFKLISLNGNTKKNNSIEMRNGFIIGCSNFSSHADGSPSVAIGLSVGDILIYTQKVTMAGEFQSVIHVQRSPFYAFDIHPSESIIASGGGPDEMNFKLWKSPEVESHTENPEENKQDNENYFND
ncbi:hypothetical protein M9Y10_004446 [Tritrichomonas musculus]|uniref:Anaphase-promoting complex subunit 4 WD40 domain-containing protein n=1 Tax=Tritrichomonas musculus TaxID=1915356 RepID=A0ABR2JSE9_9EUKA